VSLFVLSPEIEDRDEVETLRNEFTEKHAIPLSLLSLHVIYFLYMSAVCQRSISTLMGDVAVFSTLRQITAI
jgi:hypothetical protein